MAEDKEYMNIVIVGHVDHGKSSLIGRLFFDTESLPEGLMEELKKTCEMLGQKLEFAYIMDNLEEEREQGITIDTAQTFFNTEKRSYVIIDAPGHVEFVKNMITGASQADAAILIVDAEEGVREQTKRHAYILSLLGLSQVIVVMNKMDLVDYSKDRFDEVEKELKDFLSSIKIKPSYVIPISAMEGDNLARKSDKMSWYSGITVLEALDTFKIKAKPTEKPLRLPIQDIYKRDDKRIHVGRIESGTVTAGQEVIVLPNPRKTKIKSVEEWNNPQKKSAVAGESTGVTLTDPLFLDRGNVICSTDKLPKVAHKIHANVFWMSKTPVKVGERIAMKIATQEVMSVIEEISRRINSSSLEVLAENADHLENNDLGEVILKLEKELVVEDFNEVPELGRFVLEKNMDTAAGGIITHIHEVE
ncbi:MAG TPA: GTP-binding protein [Candidatus Altiarchaeales archaeon]|nr:GTP-binding protein [Candidatus Altiarchaeales archaeon]